METKLFNHAERHKELHAALDELAADYINHTKKRLCKVTLLEFMLWSATQLKSPSEKEENEEAHESKNNQHQRS